MEIDHRPRASQLSDLLDDRQMRSVCSVLRDLSVELLTCRQWRTARSNTWNRRLPDLLLYLPTQGRILCRIGEHEQVIGPGEAMLAPEGVAHGMRLVDGCTWLEAFSIHAHITVSPAAVGLDLHAMPIIRLRDPAAAFERLGVLTCLMGREPEAGRRYGAEWLRSLLVDQAMQGAPMRTPQAMIDPRIVAVLSYITHHPGETLTVEALADLAGLSVSRLRVLFRAATGTTPKSYIRELRLSKARSLLTREPDFTIQAIAERTGFNDAHYLHQVFREHVGQTPGEFRREVLGL